MMGWESEGFLQQAVDTCTDPSGLQSACPLFTIQDEYTSNQCKMPMPAIVSNDKVEGPGLFDLPGGLKDVGDVSPPISSVPYSPGSTPTGSQFAPGQIFHATETGSAPSVVQQNVPAPETPPAAMSYDAVSTQLATANHVVTEVVWEQAIAYVTEEVDVITTVTVGAEAPKMKARRRSEAHVRRHGRHGHGF